MLAAFLCNLFCVTVGRSTRKWVAIKFSMRFEGKGLLCKYKQLRAPRNFACGWAAVHAWLETLIIFLTRLYNYSHPISAKNVGPRSEELSIFFPVNRGTYIPHIYTLVYSEDGPKTYRSEEGTWLQYIPRREEVLPIVAQTCFTNDMKWNFWLDFTATFETKFRKSLHFFWSIWAFLYSISIL